MNRLRRWIARGNRYADRPWPIIAFQPVLYLFLWGALLRLLLFPPPTAGEGLSDITGGPTYYVWLGFGLVSAPLALFAWWLIAKQAGARRYRGMWFRLVADLGMFTVVLVYHLAVVFNRAAMIASIPSRYAVGAILVFLLLLIGRDVWTLHLTERAARRIRRGS